MVELRALQTNWLTFFDWPWNQPTDQIKDYFGEKIGLYFKWLGMYTTWLVAAAVLGFGFWINVATDGESRVSARLFSPLPVYVSGLVDAHVSSNKSPVLQRIADFCTLGALLAVQLPPPSCVSPV
jgi:hypothetical protein